MLDSIEIEDRKRWEVGNVQASEEAPMVRKSSKYSAEDRMSIKRAEMEARLVINEDIQVTEYSPDVFAFLRE